MTVDETAGSDVIHNPVSGETIVIRRSAAQTGGRLLAWDLRLAPRGRVPSGHTHPEQEERFTVQQGRLRFPDPSAVAAGAITSAPLVRGPGGPGLPIVTLGTGRARRVRSESTPGVRGSA